MSNHQEEELVCDDLLPEQKHFMDILILSSHEPHEAGFSCYLHFIHMGLGFAKWSDLALDHRNGRGQRQDTKPDPWLEPVLSQLWGGGRGLCPLCRLLDEVHEWCSLSPAYLSLLPV